MLSIHKASAGSGKTYTLTYHYIKLLLGRKVAGTSVYELASKQRNRHRAILAVTFTNKATDEMKQRIVARLSELATGEKCPYEADLCKDLRCSSANLRETARLALVDILNDYSLFNISTIDAFFQTVLRTFAREANLSGSFDVELDEKRTTAIGVSQMLSSVNRSHELDTYQRRRTEMLSLWLEQYMRQQIDEGKPFNIFVRRSAVTASLTSFISRALNETYKLNIDTISEYTSDFDRLPRFMKALAGVIRTTSERISTAARTLLSEAEARCVDNKMTKYIRNDVNRWAMGKDLKIGATTMKGLDNRDNRYAACSRKNVDEEFDALYTQTLELCTSLIPKLIFYRHVRDNIFCLGIIGETERCIEEYLRDNNAMLLSNTNSILRKIINQEETPFIYERIGIRLRHFLIDEFQDTSRLQWLNIKPLITESLSNGNDNLIIGDEKQAIYRFRNSDPQLLIKDVPTDFADCSIIRGRKVEENENWRSASQVVAFNNTLFSALADCLGVTDIYGGVAQRIHNKDLPGYVTISPYSSVEEALDRMVVAIKDQLRRGYRQRDIAILVNRRVEGVLAVERLMNAKEEDNELADLRIMTQEALRIDSAPTVRRIVSVLRYVDASVTFNPRNRKEADSRQVIADLINRYEFHKAHGKLSLDAIESALDESDTAPAEAAAEAIDMKCINLTSIVERIIARYVSADELRAENAYLTAFQDMVIDFSTRNDAGLHSFMKWWDENGSQRSLNVPDELDALIVMTIHKSKGLEFPCVHIPLADWDMGSSDDINWFSLKDRSSGKCIAEFDREEFDPADVPPLIPMKTAALISGTSLKNAYDEVRRNMAVDNINKTYVAFTRAVRELAVGIKSHKNASDTRISPLITRAIQHSTTDFCNRLTEERALDPDMLTPLSDLILADGSLTIGRPTTPVADTKHSDVVEMQPYYSFDNDDIWNLSRIDDIETMEKPRQMGIICHDIMCAVRHRSDLPKAVRSAVARGWLDPEASAQVENALASALADPRAAIWFDTYHRIMSERTITVKTKNRDGSSSVANYRPDRVVWTDEGTIDVVDYKFGQEEPAKYHRQVRGYMSLLRRVYPDTVIRGYLWYPLSGKIVKV